MEYTLVNPDIIFMDDDGSVLTDEQLVKFLKVCEEINPLSKILCLPGNSN